MARKPPQPRVSRFMGQTETAHVCPDGSWLEPESLCYPAGGMTRRAYALCEDNEYRLVTCGVPDTYFSIPGRVRVGGKSVRGFVSGGGSDRGYTFTAYKPKEQK